MLYIGIDPGKSGCLAVINEKKEVWFFDWPKDDDLAFYYNDLCGIEHDQVGLAVLERVHSMPGQGVKSMFTFGTNFGIWQGFLTALDWPFQLVAPQTWMKNVVAKADGPDTKAGVRNVAKRLFPKAELEGPKGGYKDGRADALLMAWYAYQQSK